jgi:hypothetical protein
VTQRRKGKARETKIVKEEEAVQDLQDESRSSPIFGGQSILDSSVQGDQPREAPSTETQEKQPDAAVQNAGGLDKLKEKEQATEVQQNTAGNETQEEHSEEATTLAQAVDNTGGLDKHEAKERATELQRKATEAKRVSKDEIEARKLRKAWCKSEESEIWGQKPPVLSPTNTGQVMEVNFSGKRRLTFAVKDVSTDGNCLFHALLQAYPYLQLSGPQEIRRAIVDFVEKGVIEGGVHLGAQDIARLRGVQFCTVDTTIVLTNGKIRCSTCAQTAHHSTQLDGVAIGRVLYL